MADGELAQKELVLWAVGTTNAAKVECVKDVTRQCFPEKAHQIIPVKVESAVAAQPMSAEESQVGARHRAEAALLAEPSAHFGVGLEGGVEKIGDKWFECGWMCVVERSTKRSGVGSSARFEMSQKIMRKIIDEKKELAEIMDELTGLSDVRSTAGAMGILTDGHLQRKEAYNHGLVFALAPFLSDKDKYWDE